ncbi:hypothetical protein WQE_34456 [Paraburkholderia hospita]|uniref:Glc operon protein GlcG n=1 Tax=Paraburkholderia hospita TaxID=169430 RepID=A0ABN0FCI3_9BURK|nr:heme-binding protein [Paraburkholderia hospita]EIM96366.1 hypothetical protein WQE_34456 [Paraburkholderia hospita]OUL70168.1 hypothetical protein CA602_48530 [Paraburkholderia hospita]
MQTKSVLTEVEVQRLMDASRLEAGKGGLAVAIAVVDDGGHLLGLVRLDNCAAIGSYISAEKARSAALGRRETKNFEDMVNGGRTAFLSAPVICSLEGGVPLVVDGQVVGAIGVSGAKPDQDALVARAGAQALFASR